MHEVLIFVGETSGLRDLLRVASDRRAVTRGHAIAKVERVQQGAEQADLEARELPRSPFQLLGALLGDEQLPEQMLKGERCGRRELCRPPSWLPPPRRR